MMNWPMPAAPPQDVRTMNAGAMLRDEFAPAGVYVDTATYGSSLQVQPLTLSMVVWFAFAQSRECATRSDALRAVMLGFPS
jgi:hypothetical protein